jgi:YfiH family protein
VRAVTSTRADGDFHLTEVDPTVLAARRRALVDLPWAMLDEVHGIDVVTVTEPTRADRRSGDVAVTDRPDVVLGVWTGDCAPVVLVAPSGRFAVAHAGWRGLAAGVVDRAVDAVDPNGHGGIRAFIGPLIGGCCNEFGESDLTRVAADLACERDVITSRTTWGSISLDVPRALTLVLSRHGVEVTHDGRCTRDDARLFSHRRGDEGRQVTAVWRPR